MYLQSAEIQNFRGIRHLAIDFERDTTVLIGENAWGKSSLLYALFAILGQGDQNLCTFTSDDLYIPIKLASDTSPESAPVPQIAPEPLSAANAAAAGSEGTSAEAGTSSDAVRYDLSYLKEHKLSGLKPLKSLSSPNFERRIYQVPNPFGPGKIYRIVDLPRLGRNPKDRRGLIDCYLEALPPELNPAKAPVTAPPSTKPRWLNSTLNRFISWLSKDKTPDTPKPDAGATARSSGDSSPRTKLSALAQSLYGDFADLHEGMLYEEQYEQSQPLYYRPTTAERMERTKQRLEPDSGLNAEARSQAQKDLDFACRDVFDAHSEQIVIDLVFCESSYGALNNTERFAALKGASYQGPDDLYRIHYRIRAQYCQEPKPNCPEGEVRFNTDGFITVHELLDDKGQPLPNPLPIIRELIVLNPLLRLRDRRMFNSPFSHAPQAADPVVVSPSATPVSSEPTGARTALGQAATNLMVADVPHSAIEPSDMQAITHFFDNITSDDELTSSKINEGIAVLNTIASKYLTNYQSTQLGTAIKTQPDHTLKVLEDGARPVRTAREIVATPISMGTLTSLKAALADRKPSSSKFLLSLLAGALLMSQGQRTIDTYSRPILVLEDIESRFHPTLLLNLWSILQTLPIQKIVTTNSAQFVSAISLHKLRRLCKQYYDVRCFQIGANVFGNDEERKIAFHVRMIRPSALFARCWLLVEGETEVWILNEIANILGLNLSCNGVQLIEFAQCGLNPLIKLAQQLGISYHVLTDGDEAGRHYAQTVREFAGGASLADHLSVMPHVDIEHYLYTSGFANVYQRAANLELKPKRQNASDLGISNKNLRAKVNELIHNPSLKIYYLAIDQVPYFIAPGYDPKRAPNVNHLTINVDLGDAPTKDAQSKGTNAAPQSKGAQSKRAQGQATIDLSKAQGTAAKKSGNKPARKAHQPKQKLIHHQLAAVIKTLMEHGITKKCPCFNKIFNRSKLQRKVAQATSFNLDALSEADVNTLYSYLRGLVTTMPHPARGLTAKQSSYIQELKALRAKLLAQVNTNRQRLNAQLQKQQTKERARALQAQAAARPGKAIPTHELDQEPKQAVLTAHFDFISNSQGTVLGQPEIAPMSEAQALIAHLTELASEDKLDAKDLNRLKLLERDQGNTINERYGALNDAALSHKGLSVNKVIEDAIHRKTKPGLAILVGEAMQQRGPESVPVLFKTMFRKIQRMAQNEYGLE